MRGGKEGREEGGRGGCVWICAAQSIETKRGPPSHTHTHTHTHTHARRADKNMYRIAALLALVACSVRLPTASAKITVVPYEGAFRTGYVFGGAPKVNGVQTFPSKSVR